MATSSVQVTVGTFWFGFVLLLIAFYGNPDLIDAIIYYLMQVR